MCILPQLKKGKKGNKIMWSSEIEEEGKWGVIANGQDVSFWDDENALELDSGDGCTLWIYQNQQSSHF